MDVVSLALAKGYANEQLNKLPQNGPTKKVTFDGGIYSVGADVVEGQISDVVLKGNTWTNKAGAGDTSPQTVSNLDATKTYLLINDAGANITIDTVDTPTPVKLTGATEFGFEWASGKIALYELSMAEAALDAAVLGQKYHYVSDTKSTNSVRVKSVGKNLFDGELELGLYDSITGIKTASTSYMRSANKLIIKPSTSYKISSDNSFYKFFVYEWDVNSNYIGRLDAGVSGEFTTSSSAHRITIGTKSSGMNETSTLIQIELNTATEYEPYKESIVNVNLPEPLRSLPNGVKDEIRVCRGKAELIKKTKQTGALVGNDVVASEYIHGTNTYAFISSTTTGYFPDGLAGSKLIGYCQDGDFKGNANVTVDERGMHLLRDNNRIYTRIEKGKIDSMVGTTLIKKAKAYFDLYPVTLTYQLAEPIVTKLPYQAPLKVFPNGHIFVEPLGDPTQTTLPSVELTVPIGNYNKVGMATKDYAGAAADWVLNTDESKCLLLKATNAGANANIIAPDVPGVIYTVNNLTTKTITIKKSGGTGVAITTAKTALVMHNGTDYIKITGEV